jgi:tetratricopeptide (TPR) repeat protein
MVQVYLRPKNSDYSRIKPSVLRSDLANVPKPALELYQKAILLSRNGDIRKAVEELERAIATFPQFTAALIEIGVQYIKLEEFDRAGVSFKSALALAPEDFTARLGYGIALQHKNNFPESQKQFREALRQNEKSATCHMYLGITLVGLKNLKEAQKELELAQSLDGGDGLPQVHKYLGGIYWGRGEYKRAANELEMYLKLAPAAPDAERARAAIKELRSKGE